MDEAEADRMLREMRSERSGCRGCGYIGDHHPNCQGLKNDLAREQIAALNRAAGGLHAIAQALRTPVPPKPAAPFAVGDTVRCREEYWPTALHGFPRVGCVYDVAAVALYDEATGDPLPHPMLRLEGFDGAWNCEGFEREPSSASGRDGERGSGRGPS